MPTVSLLHLISGRFTFIIIYVFLSYYVRSSEYVAVAVNYLSQNVYTICSDVMNTK